MSSDLITPDALAAPAEPLTTDGDGAVLVQMIGAPGSGKSSLARRLFREGSIHSLDGFRRQLGETAADQSTTAAAVEMMRILVGWRMAARLTTVVDATNTLPEYRARTLDLARAAGVPAVAFVLHTPAEDCVARRTREERDAAGRISHGVPEQIVRKLHDQIAAHPPTLDEFDMIIHVSPYGTDMLYQGELPHRARAGAMWWPGEDMPALTLDDDQRAWPLLWERGR